MSIPVLTSPPPVAPQAAPLASPMGSARPSRAGGVPGVYVLFSFLTIAAVVILLVNPSFPSWTDALDILFAPWFLLFLGRENPWGWPLQLSISAIVIVVDRNRLLFSGVTQDSVLSSVRVVILALGWYWWVRGGEGGAPIRIRRMSPAMVAAFAAATIVGTAALARIYATDTPPDPAPLIDALTTVLGPVALLMLARKLLEGWAVSFAINAILIAQFVRPGQGLYAVGYVLDLVYVVLVVLSLAGLVAWWRRLRKDEAESPRP